MTHDDPGTARGSSPRRRDPRGALTAWVLLAIVSIALAFGLLSIDLLNAARGYVTGESLWSKGQKDAVDHL